MPTVYETGIAAAYEQAWRRDPMWLTVVAETNTRLRKGFYPSDMVNALGQLYFHITPEETYAFIQMWSWLFDGKLFVAQLACSDHPGGDASKEHNNSALSHLSQSSGIAVLAEFWGGMGDHDGFVDVLEDILLSTVNGTQEDVAWKGRANLEVGYQAFSKTLIMLRQYGVLARWPYDSDYVWLFKLSHDMTMAGGRLFSWGGG